MCHQETRPTHLLCLPGDILAKDITRHVTRHRKIVWQPRGSKNGNLQLGWKVKGDDYLVIVVKSESNDLLLIVPVPSTRSPFAFPGVRLSNVLLNSHAFFIFISVSTRGWCHPGPPPVMLLSLGAKSRYD